MTKEEKNLIIKDLGCRLYTDTQIYISSDSSDHGFQEGEYDNILMPYHIEAFKAGTIDIVPYLRSIENMSEEEEKELEKLVFDHVAQQSDEWELYTGGTGIKNLIGGARFYWEDLAPIYDFLNEHHFNYRLPEGLYDEAPEGMYK